MTTKEQIIACEHQLLLAMKSSDLKSLDELIHDDLTFVIPGGQVFTKEMDLASHRSADFKVDDMKLLNQEIKLIDDTAVVSAKVKMVGMFGDHVIDGKFHYLRVWKLSRNEWKIIAGSSIMLPD